MEQCEFCSSAKNQEVISNEFIKVLCPNRPVVDGHLMIMPIRHIAHYDEMDDRESIALKNMVAFIVKLFKNKHNSSGYNLLNNNGKKAGQKIDHFHIHFFPRFETEEMSPFAVLSNPTAYNRPKLEGEDLNKLVSELKIFLSK